MPISPQNGEITKIWCLFSIGSDVRSAEHLETKKKETRTLSDSLKKKLPC